MWNFNLVWLLQLWSRKKLFSKISISGREEVKKKRILSATTTACGPFTKNKERIKKIMQTGNTDFIYRNELDKACFNYDMAYGKSKYLTKRNQSDKVLWDKAFKIASDPKYDGYQRGLASMFYKSFEKKSSGSGNTNENYQLANELHKHIIRKF